MSDLDKKIISLILVFILMFIPFSTIVKAVEDNDDLLKPMSMPNFSNAVYTNTNPALKENTEKAMLYFNHVLTSSGDLYCQNINNPTSKMTKIDSNVSKFIYCELSYGLHLKTDNTAVVTSNTEKLKTYYNVKDIGYDGNIITYLSKNNELYRIYRGNNSEWTEKKIQTGVDKLIGSLVYCKDGKTYSLSGTKLLDTEAQGGYRFDFQSYIFKGNNLYLLKYGDKLSLATDKFNHFQYGSFQYPIGRVDTDGSTVDTMSNNCISTDYGFSLTKDNVFMYKNKTVMTNVFYAKVYYGWESNLWWHLLLRTDGSVWAVMQDGTAVCVLENTKKTKTFNDVSTSSWYYNAVNYVYTNNIIKGYNDSTFAPDDQLTRGMLATILYRMEGEQKVTGTPKFPDVQDSSKFYYKSVKWATDNGIVAGYNNGNFGPEDNITREQLAVILNRYASYKKKDVSKTNDLKKFSDTAKISDYAVNSLKWAVGSGVITGNADGTLNPKGNATRAEVAAMMEKYCKNVGR